MKGKIWITNNPITRIGMQLGELIEHLEECGFTYIQFNNDGVRLNNPDGYYINEISKDLDNEYAQLYAYGNNSRFGVAYRKASH